MSQIYLSSTSSTNDYLKELSERLPMPEWSTVRAGYQTIGKGQRGNSWQSLPDENLLVSYFLKPTFIAPFASFDLNRMICNALLRLLNGYGIDHVEIKWPNDIIVNRHKIAGVLIENSLSLKAVENSIIGIGLNVNQKAFSELKNPVISMSQILDMQLDLEEVFVRLTNELKVSYQNLQYDLVGLRSFFFQNLYGVKNKFQYIHEGRRLEGKIMEISEEGRLAVQLDDKIVFYYSKEIEFVLID